MQSAREDDLEIISTDKYLGGKVRWKGVQRRIRLARIELDMLWTTGRVVGLCSGSLEVTSSMKAVN